MNMNALGEEKYGTKLHVHGGLTKQSSLPKANYQNSEASDRKVHNIDRSRYTCQHDM